MADASWGYDPNVDYGQLARDRGIDLTQFDTQAYLNNYADLASAGVDTPEEALRHYVLYGNAEGRNGAATVLNGGNTDPNQLVGYNDTVDTGQNQTQLDNTWGLDAMGGQDINALMRSRGIYDTLDPTAYMSAYSDLAGAGIDTPEEAMRHYVLYGAAEGRDQGVTPWAAPEGFNAYEYLTLNPDVRAAGADALQHYREFGQNEGRKYDIAGIDLQNDALRYFNPDYYKQQRPDVVEAGVDPLEHYINFGRFEGTYQSPLHQYAAQLMQFDPQYYLSQNQDVADAMRAGTMLSPLQHFSMFGAKEQRSPYEGWSATPPQPQTPSPTSPWGRQPWQTQMQPFWSSQPNYYNNPYSYFNYNPMQPFGGFGGGMGGGFGGYGSSGGFGGFGRMAGGALGGMGNTMQQWYF